MVEEEFKETIFETSPSCIRVLIIGNSDYKEESKH